MDFHICPTLIIQTSEYGERPLSWLSFVTIRSRGYPVWSELITWGIKSRELSPPGDGSGSERGLKHKKELMHHYRLEVGHMRRNSGSLGCWERPAVIPHKEMETSAHSNKEVNLLRSWNEPGTDCFSGFPGKRPSWPIAWFWFQPCEILSIEPSLACPSFWPTELWPNKWMLF